MAGHATHVVWPGRRVPTHLVTRGARRGLKLVPERHVRYERASVRVQPPLRPVASATIPHTKDDDSCNREQPNPTPASAVVTVIPECNKGRRDGGCARHADGRRRVRGTPGAGHAARPERHHMDQTLRRRTPIPYYGQKLTRTLCGLRRHRRGSGHHGQTNQQK